MLFSTARVQCGPQDDSIAMIPCNSSHSSFSSPLISRTHRPSWWLEALIARPPASVPKQSTIRMEVILPVMTLIITLLPSAWTFRHACHVKFKARQSPKQESRVIWDGRSVSQSPPSYEYLDGRLIFLLNTRQYEICLGLVSVRFSSG